MLKENFISQAPDEESNAKIMALDNNKTLIIDQFTTNPDWGELQLFQKEVDNGKITNPGPINMESVFDFYKPSVEVEFQDENGGIVQETLSFKELRDFEANGGSGRLVTNSPFLSSTKSKIDVSSKIRKQIMQNRRLRGILMDEKKKAELKEVLEELLKEIKK